MNFVKLLKDAIPTPQEMKVGITNWLKENGKFWGVSVGMHLVVFLILGVAIGAPQAKKLLQEVVFFDTEVDEAVEEAPITHFDVGETPIEPTVLNTETLTEPPAATIEQDAQFNDNSAVFEESGGGMASAATASFGGLGGFDVSAIGAGPAVRGPGGVGVGVGTSDKGGSGGAGEGFGGRGLGARRTTPARGGGAGRGGEGGRGFLLFPTKRNPVSVCLSPALFSPHPQPPPFVPPPRGGGPPPPATAIRRSWPSRRRRAAEPPTRPARK